MQSKKSPARPMEIGVGELVPQPALVITAMSAVQAAVTRTPLSTALMLGLSAAHGAPIELLPLAIVSSYVAVWTARAVGAPTFFAYPSPRCDPETESSQNSRPGRSLKR